MERRLLAQTARSDAELPWLRAAQPGMQSNPVPATTATNSIRLNASEPGDIGRERSHISPNAQFKLNPTRKFIDGSRCD
jgi:hypothetical protein